MVKRINNLADDIIKYSSQLQAEQKELKGMTKKEFKNILLKIY